jgi:hypothetical protein
MRKFFIKLLMVSMFFGVPFTAFGGLVASLSDRYALVIGNADYRNIAKLQTPVKDAQDMAAALEKLGFTVDLRLNVGVVEMTRAVEEYSARLTVSSEGIFWFARHGVQARNEAYMLAVDADTATETTLKAGAISVRNLLESLERAKNRVNTVVIDSSMTPMAASETEIAMTPLILKNFPNDIFYIQSTSPGQPAMDHLAGSGHSPFAQAFLNNINKPEPLNLLISDIVRETFTASGGTQKPFYQSYLLNNKTYALCRYEDVRRNQSIR